MHRLSVFVPSYFTKNGQTEYHVRVERGGEVLSNTSHRYSDFRRLHKALNQVEDRATIGGLEPGRFPVPKRLLKWASWVRSERQKKLSQYLNVVLVNEPVPDALAAFLRLEAAAEPEPVVRELPPPTLDDSGKLEQMQLEYAPPASDPPLDAEPKLEHAPPPSDQPVDAEPSLLSPHSARFPPLSAKDEPSARGDAEVAADGTASEADGSPSVGRPAAASWARSVGRHLPSGQCRAACVFPMYAMPVSVLLSLKSMEPHEEMLANGRVVEWSPDKHGPCHFLSHQWSSYAHPDPEGEQLACIQSVLRRIMAGEMGEMFATAREARVFHDAGVDDTTMAADVRDGYAWLDYACVPQAKENEASRLRAIDSIPYYIANSLCFFAVVPRVKHKDIKGAVCDYATWLSRGWCRLEQQANELKLERRHASDRAHAQPRRPIIVHTDGLLSTHSTSDWFYMGWQRATSIFNGEFTCCRLNHQRVCDDGTVVTLPCDKDRIRPLVSALWDIKIEQVSADRSTEAKAHELWRFVSHRQMMLSEGLSDGAGSDDGTLKTLEDVAAKYHLLRDGPAAFLRDSDDTVQAMQARDGHPRRAGDAPWGRELREWAGRFLALGGGGSSHVPLLVQYATMYVVAEGNATMLRRLHREHGADLSLGFPWGITLLEFAAGKAHLRVMRYLLAQGGAAADVNHRSIREGITAVDRACKAGHVDVLRLLLAYGAKVDVRRRDGQRPAHGAAWGGHLHVLQELHSLGCDLWSADDSGVTPLMAARDAFQYDAAAYLERLEAARPRTSSASSTSGLLVGD